MTLLNRIFGGTHGRESYRPLYVAIVNAARDPCWYLEGEVPDTVDGRFDMVAAVLALTLLRLEEEGERMQVASVLLTEIFVEDMDGSVRQMGIGDLMVGKHIGKMMGALGGRLAAFRAEIGSGADFTNPVRKNIFRDAPPSDEALHYVSSRLRAFHGRLRTATAEQLLAGKLPA